MMKIPTKPVIKPPVLKLIYLGARLAKSLAGLTTLAAMFTEIVAIAIPRSEANAINTLMIEFSIRGFSSPGGGVEDVICDRI